MKGRLPVPSFPSLLLLLCLPPAAATAQTTRVVPGICTGLEGTSHCVPPFYYETVRCQLLYRVGALTKVNGLLTGVQFRRDGIYQVAFATCTRDIRIDFYQTPVSPAAMTGTFTANRGTNPPATLFSGKVNLPALPIPAAAPAPWAVQFAFTRPQPFDVTKGNVLLEFVHRGPGTGYNRYYVDGDYLPKYPAGRSILMGVHCLGANQEAIQYDPEPTTWILGGKAEAGWGAGGTGPTSILAFLGNRSDTWGPVKLPFDLAPLGGTGATTSPCMLYTNHLAGQVVGLNQKAIFGPIPRQPALTGLMLFTQAISAAPKANPLGVITGPAYRMIIGSDQAPAPDVNMMFMHNNLSAATGLLGGGLSGHKGPVTRFTGVFN